MRVNGTPLRTIWPVAGTRAVDIIDQTALPQTFACCRSGQLEDAAQAIRSMQVRGAPLIGVTAAYGLALALATVPTTPPCWRRRDAGGDAADGGQPALGAGADAVPPAAAAAAAAGRRRLARGGRIADEDVEQCRRIGEHGLQLLLAGRRGAGASRS
jgi:methylthioribose-1-phosphate isomerase